MCDLCAQGYDTTIDTPAVRAAAEAIAEVYKHHSVSGGLHIVIDDWNIETEHVVWCRYHLDEYGGEAGSELRAAEERCVAALLPLSEDERASALKMAHAR